MPDARDMDLVREYARHQSESAFAELVRRHIALVYSVALRFTRNPPDAEDVAQAVFVILARKAARLRTGTILTGWLYETTRLTALQWLRNQSRRRRHEQEAHMQSTLDNHNADAAWRQMEPLLEQAMSRLNRKDRTLLALRFYENRSGAEMAAILGIGEWAARKRAGRALQRLRDYLAKRGVHSTTTAIAEAISANSVQAAPAVLAKTVTAVALAKGAAVSSSTLTLVKGALKLMAWTKGKTAVVVGAGILLVAGTTTVTVKEVHQHENSEWDIGRVDTRILRTGPHIVKIIPSRFPNPGGWASIGNGRVIGVGDSPLLVVLAAYGGDPHRTMLLTTLPQKRYDFIANLLSGSQAALQREVTRELGLVARRETVTTNVLFLRIANSHAPGLRPASTTAGVNSTSEKPGDIHLVNMPVGDIAGYLENLFDIPIFDQTGLKGRYYVNLKWDARNDPQHENLKRALRGQLGLELVPGTAPVKMLMVEKAK